MAENSGTDRYETNRSLAPSRPSGLSPWKNQPPGFWIIVLMLLISGGIAIAQGGWLLAMVIYLVNFLALLWPLKNK